MTKRFMVACAAVVAAAGLAGAEEAQPGKWDVSVAAGLTATDGNSDTRQGTVSVLGERKADTDQYRTGLEFAYGETEGSNTLENGKAFAGWRHLVSERAYGLVDLTVAYDAIADVDYRATLAPGVGYFLMKDDLAQLGVEAGPAYVWEKVGGVSDDYLALRFAERYDRKLSDTATCWQSIEYLPRADDFDDYLLSAEIGVEAALNAKLSVRLVVKDQYDSTPAADRKQNDLTVIGALAYRL